MQFEHKIPDFKITKPVIYKKQCLKQNYYNKLMNCQGVIF